MGWAASDTWLQLDMPDEILAVWMQGRDCSYNLLPHENFVRPRPHIRAC